ncbi:MAG: type II secretion system inner membrane protein GspF [Betaproteobacteria bacterium]|nr:type II secretion system inner membrane protein GspF [Betaproteobacteria bacterium]MBV9360766.1 type II secretion system inner membrane protein GspF [Betaproteobacteria bacterium]
MPSFRFEAADASGRIEKGLVEADSAPAARAALRAKGLVPLGVDAISGQKKTVLRRRRFSEAELSLATRQLSSLLAAGLPVAQALGAAIEQAENKAVREVFAAVRSDVFAGHRLAEALAQFPREFPDVYRASVAAGEDSGELAGVMDRLATYLEERLALRSKVFAAFLYPAVVTGVAFAIVVFLMTYVVPQVVEVFANTRQALPWPTRVLLAISWFTRVGGIWLAAVLVGAFFAVRAWLRLPGRRLVVDRWLLSLPLFGRILRGVDTARFASTLAILTGAGVPLLRALDAARATLANMVLATAVSEVIEAVREGQGLATALGRSKVFPPVLVHLAASGESTGKLDTMLERAAANLSVEAERRALALSTLLEPLLILAMGAIVLGIVLAVLMPIIEINQLVR